MTKLLAKLNSNAMQPRLQEMLAKLKKRQAMDENRHQWNIEAPRSPNRLRCLKAALKLHVDYERFLDAGRKALEA